MKIEIQRLVLDYDIYPRTRVNDYYVGRLVAAFKAGAKFPPLVIEASSIRVIDGFHRYHVYLDQEVKKIDVITKTYANEADLFADAVRLNISHGEPLDSYSVKRAVLRLQEYGYQKDQISEVVRLPIGNIDKIERGFASNEKGGPIALKGGLSHLAQTTLTTDKEEVNKHYSGQKATFYLNQLCELLQHDMWPRSEGFASAMNNLISLWDKINKEAENA